MNHLRAAMRLAFLGGLISWSLPTGFACRDLRHRAAWMQRLSRRILRLFGATVRVNGTMPAEGLIVCNHLGYLDVLVIGSLRPAVFVAKSDVRAWPVIGLLCRLAGTLFVRRDRRAAVAGSVREIHAALAERLPVVLFPEGTSTDGSTVLPLKTSLLAAVESAPFTAAAIAYDLPGGSVADEICYWRDMTFAPHFWNILGKPGFTARLRFGESQPAGSDRKSTGAALHFQILQLLGKGESRVPGEVAQRSSETPPDASRLPAEATRLL